MDDIIPQKPKEGEPWEVIIIGSGPAGLTAAIYTTRAALSTLVIGGYKWGGQLMLTTEVDNYPGFPEGIMGPELMEKMRRQAERFGAEIKFEDVESVNLSMRPFKIIANGITYSGKSVIIATGADTLWLGLESEQRLIGRGVSSCAPCDAPFFREKRVVVVGGGDSAMEEALVLTKYTAEVIIVHRRDSFRASDIMQKKVMSNPKVKIIWDTVVEEILGETKVTGVKLKNLKTGELKDMEIEGIFVAIGHNPATKLFAGKIELDQKGYVKQMLNERGESIGNAFSTTTSVEGVFVAGDVHDYHYRQAVTAAGFGCQAAMDVDKWLESQK